MSEIDNLIHSIEARAEAGRTKMDQMRAQQKASQVVLPPHEPVKEIQTNEIRGSEAYNRSAEGVVIGRRTGNF